MRGARVWFWQKLEHYRSNQIIGLPADAAECGRSVAGSFIRHCTILMLLRAMNDLGCQNPIYDIFHTYRLKRVIAHPRDDEIAKYCITDRTSELVRNEPL